MYNRKTSKTWKEKKKIPPPKKHGDGFIFSPQKAIFQKRFLTASSLIINIDAQKCRPTLMNNVPHNMKQFKNVVCCTFFFFCDYIVVCPLPMSLYCILHLPVLDYYLVSSYPPPSSLLQGVDKPPPGSTPCAFSQSTFLCMYSIPLKSSA